MQRFFTVIVLFAISLSFTAFGQDNSDGQLIHQRENTLMGSAQGSLQLLLGGHSSNISCVDWSPDGSKVITGSRMENRAIIWSAITGKIMSTLDQDMGGIRLIRWSPDGTKIATLLSTGFVNGTALVIWDAFSGFPIVTNTDSKYNFMYMDWSPDGTKILTGGWENTAAIWDANNGKQLRTLIGHKNDLSSVKWDPTSSKVITSSYDSTAIIWSAITGDPLLTLKGHHGIVNDAVWSPDGKMIITSSTDSTSIVWSTVTGEILVTLKEQKQEIRGARWNSMGTKIITTGSTDNLLIWDGKSGKLLSKVESPSYGSIGEWSPDGSKFSNGKEIWETNNVAKKITFNLSTEPIEEFRWDPTGTKIITASTNNSTNIWSASDGTPLISLKSNIMPGGINDICWSPDGTKIASICRLTDSTTMVAVWSAINATRLFTFIAAQPNLYSAFPTLTWSPDGAKIATTHNNIAIAWSAVTGQKIYTLVGHQSIIESLNWSPDGSKIVTNADTYEPSFIWSATDGKLIKKLNSNPTENSGCWNNDGTQILSISYGQGLIRDVSNWSLIKYFSKEGTKDFVAPIRWNPKGSTIVANSLENPPSIWDIDSKLKTITLGDQKSVNKIEFSADGSKVSTLDEKNIPYVWSSITGNKLCMLEEHNNKAEELVWSPSSANIASVVNGKVLVWSAETGKKIFSIKESSSILKWSPNGDRLATAHYSDGNILIWNTGESTAVQDVASTTTTIPNTFTIYPNPTSDQFTLHFKQATRSESTLQLMNMLGQTVAEIALPVGCTEQIIPTESLAAGMYIAKVNSSVQSIIKW